MKYKNITNKIIPHKINGIWKDIQQGKVIELGGRAKQIKGLELVEIEVEVESENIGNFADEAKLKNMTKDQLNDYSAKIGFEEVNTSITKKKMIDLIMGYQNEEA